MRTTHPPQVPLPPQGASISIPACRAASSSSVPAGTSIVFPAGLKLIIGIKINKNFDQTFLKVWPPAGPPEAVALIIDFKSETRNKSKIQIKNV
jgi:hypothetical protein